MCGLAVGLLEWSIKGYLIYIFIVGSLEFRVYGVDLIHTECALIIEILKHSLIFDFIIFCLFFEILELVSFREIVPGKIRIQFCQGLRVKVLCELPEQYDIILDEVISKTVPFLWLEVFVVLIEL